MRDNTREWVFDQCSQSSSQAFPSRLTFRSLKRSSSSSYMESIAPRMRCPASWLITNRETTTATGGRPPAPRGKQRHETPAAVTNGDNMSSVRCFVKGQVRPLASHPSPGKGTCITQGASPACPECNRPSPRRYAPRSPGCRHLVRSFIPD